MVMNWFRKSKQDGARDLKTVEVPWQGEVSIYSHIKKHIAGNTRGLTPDASRLPDEQDDGKLKWVAGGLDGAFGHHSGGGSKKSRASAVYNALGPVLDEVTPAGLRKLYGLLLEYSVIDYIDSLLELIVENEELDLERLEELAIWIATRAPDREPVKLALALLGVVCGPDQSELLLILGRHEEFTLFAAVALIHAHEDAENFLFELARQVDGWGRIQVVERLADTTNPEIKQWMLRDGYRNSVMYEYLAYTCAQAGGLRDHLAQEHVEPAILTGAGDIIEALFNGGPAEDMDDYEDGAFVVERYLHHIGDKPTKIEELLVIESIQLFLQEEEVDWTARETRGWTPALREQLAAQVVALKALPHWNETINAGLASSDSVTFYRADQAASALGIDTWDINFDRLESETGDGWYFVMQTDDPQRIDRVILLAEKVLPLAEIGSGPAEELGMGPDWVKHGHLDFVLQDLRRFPGKGWPLIQAGLRSPVVRNRNMALRALSPWGMEAWPADARGLLERALDEEPNADVRERMKTLLAGKEIEE